MTKRGEEKALNKREREREKVQSFANKVKCCFDVQSNLPSAWKCATNLILKKVPERNPVP